VRKTTLLALISIFICAFQGCDEPRRVKPPKTPPNIKPHAATRGEQKKDSNPVVDAARRQIGVTVYYSPKYARLKYPGGDVPRNRGVCTDVVVRALRDAFGMDLQKLVREDMDKAFSAYPKIWGLKNPDSNIDHRRVPNLMTYFKRGGFSIAPTKKTSDYLPGDLVTCLVGKRPHIMVVSDRKNSDGVPLVIHNIGAGVQEEDRLFDFTITGHFRVKPEINGERQRR